MDLLPTTTTSEASSINQVMTEIPTDSRELEAMLSSVSTPTYVNKDNTVVAKEVSFSKG